MAKLCEDEPRVHEDVELVDVQIGRYCEIGKGSRIAYSQIGDYSYCDRYADIASAEVGKFANIASFVRIGATDHPMERASLHHFLYRSDDYWEDAGRDEAFFERRHARRAVIGHDTWIGHNAQIKPGVTVGHGAVIASGSVVTKDVAPYLIVAGVPAVPMRERFTAPVTARLMTLAWWDWDHAQLRLALNDFRALSIEAFLEKYE
ncbi:DapH/DapD/GlmU-related protein [Thalassovita taeanensis]|uniref:Chloramphenicol acetyltransferase n=1 Tax=Thalassovita taeanensis TaxID=657014 RepID=A0A1H9C1E1_9RHOB|nr:DapH/DapD/GlmU-related protein [Thalassovita taeanensis]SEP94623.1 hypothetical protein SAMN04488092_10376 [Thalassovita taeanensis]